MKILWLSHLVPYPPKGGVLQRSFNMLKEAGKYHNITLMAFNQKEFLKASLPDAQDPLMHAYEELIKYVDVIEFFDIPENLFPGGKYWIALKAITFGSSYNMEWLKSKKYREALKKTLENNSFDLVHIDTISLCVFFDLFEHLPVVLNHHNFESQMLYERSKSETNFFKKIYYLIESRRLSQSEKQFCIESDLNITCSDLDASSMRRIVGKDTFLSVPNAVDRSYFFPNPSTVPTQRKLLLVGGLSWYPNREAVEFFMHKVWPLLKKEIPGVQVDIVGRNPTPEMLNLASEDTDFCVHGFVDDVRPYLWDAHFYLCPIRIGGGTKLKILDALASGCCIVAHPFACKGIDVTNGIEVLYAERPEDYVNTIKYVMRNQELEKSLRSAGPELIKKFYSYERVGKDYSNSIIELTRTR